MAVIRQRREVIDKPIGVIRADTSSAQAYESIGNLADTLIETSFNALKREAKQAGTTSAQRQTAEGLRTINPETGLPEAFQAPEGYGTIAQDAYQRVIEARFTGLVEADFKAEAKRLAIKHQFDKDGVKKFEDAFKAFYQGYGTETFEKNVKVDPKIAGIVNSIGSQLLASNKMNLLEKHAIRERQETVTDFTTQFTEGLSQLEYLYADPASANDARFLEDVLGARLKDMIRSGLITSDTQIRQSKNQILKTKARGLARKVEQDIVASDGMDSATMALAERVIRNNGNGIEDLPDAVQKSVQEILDIKVDGRSATAIILPDVEAYFNDAKSDMNSLESAARFEQTQKEKEDRETLRLRRQEQEEKSGTNLQTTVDTISKHLADFDIPSAINEFNTYEKSVRSTLMSEPFKENLIKKARTVILQDLARQATTSQTREPLPTSDELSRWQTYILSDGRDVIGDKLPPKLQTLADEILKIYRRESDEPSMIRATNAEVNKVIRNEKDEALTKTEQETKMAVESGFGSTTNSNHREYVGKVVFRGKPDNYVFSPDSLTDNQMRTQIINAGILPQQMYDFGKKYLTRSMSPQEEIVFLQHYNNYRNALSANNQAGEFRNMWLDAGYSIKEVGLIDSVIYAASTHPEGIQAAPQIRATIMQARRDSDNYGAAVANSTGGKGIREFVDEITTSDPWFGIDVPNPQITSELIPYTEYFIAMGASPEELKTKLTGIMKDYYKETDGVVVDLPFGSISKSRNSFSSIFPQDQHRDMAVKWLNNQLVNTYEVQDAYFRRSFMPTTEFAETSSTAFDTEFGDTAMEQTDIPEPERLYLQPFPMSGTAQNNTRFMVMKKNAGGGYQPYIANGQMVAFDTAQIVKGVEEMLGEAPVLGKATQEQIARREQMRLQGSTMTAEQAQDREIQAP